MAKKIGQTIEDDDEGVDHEMANERGDNDLDRANAEETRSNPEAEPEKPKEVEEATDWFENGNTEERAVDQAGDNSINHAEPTITEIAASVNKVANNPTNRKDNTSTPINKRQHETSASSANSSSSSPTPNPALSKKQQNKKLK